MGPPITVVYIALSSGPGQPGGQPCRKGTFSCIARTLSTVVSRCHARTGGQRKVSGKLFGDARVSVASDADANNSENQRRVLVDCEQVFEDVGSGASWKRLGLNLPKTTLAPGGCVKIAGQDRLGRSRQKCWSWWAGCVRIRPILVSQLQVLAPGWTFSTGPPWRP